MDDLRHYLDSIRKPFEDKLAAVDFPDHEDIAVAMVPLLIIFIIAIPFTSGEVVKWVFVRNGISVSTRPFVLIALIVFGLSSFGMAVATVLWSAWDRHRQRTGLPAPQMRFALCYRIIEELGFYERNGLEQHVKEASRLWRVLFAYLYLMLNPNNRSFIRARRSPWEYNPLIPMLNHVRSGLPWIRFAPESEHVIEAFDTLRQKISNRLRTKTEIHELRACLAPLSRFLYTLIPGRPDPDVEIRPDAQLAEFAELLQRLSPYVGEKPALGPSRMLVSLRWAMGLFSHENVLGRFFSWYVLLNFLFAVGVSFAKASSADFRVDTAIIAAWVGVPLVGAVTAAATLSRRS